MTEAASLFADVGRVTGFMAGKPLVTWFDKNTLPGTVKYA